MDAGAAVGAVEREERAAVCAVLRARAGEVAAAMAARCAEEIPAYRSLPAGIRSDELGANVRRVLELFVTLVAEDRPATDEELAGPVAWGAERARDGVPLADVLRVYPLAAREAWRAMTADAGLDGRVLVEDLLVLLGAVMPRVAEGYLRERSALDVERRADREAVAAALLSGRAPRRSTQGHDLVLADAYEVLVFRLPEPASGHPPTRVYRALRLELDRLGVPATVRDGGGVLFLPRPSGREDGRDRALPARPPAPTARHALDRLDAVTGLACTAAVSPAVGHAAVPEAYEEAGEVLALCRALERPAGLYRLADLAIEYQLARPSPARDALVRTLDGLRGHPHLLDTLRTFLAAGCHRAEAAARLTVHRNTLTYRLHRVEVLTGQDPTHPDAARLLAAAVTAYDIVRAADGT
ncbi:helix-turn-helix domain-containing protein [Streptomyces sp. NPDC001941]|uniref:PucR family transcriptional regulator n=1 Tax=Streptomyces sp. NPDC001941 TaxID=3154659 RepID=UPI00332D9EBC